LMLQDAWAWISASLPSASGKSSMDIIIVVACFLFFFFGCDRSEFISPDLVLALTSHRSSCFHFSIDQ
jgi:hypothetical protein